jgi:UDP-N-acetyl-D-mannosaminuronic acid dehydrogenase
LEKQFARDVVIIGGCGRAGLPLGIALASRGLTVTVYDINATAVQTVNEAIMPFDEEGGQEMLADVVGAGRLNASTDPASVSTAEHVIVIVGTPIDSHLYPDVGAVPRAVDQVAEYLRPGQLMILRSTVYPGVTALVEKLLERKAVKVDVAFCPERIAEGKALTELFSLPQIIAARTPEVLARSENFFRVLTDKLVPLVPEEAELAKLYTNTYRYVKFATANQFWMMANDFGLDYQRIRHAITYDYPRAADLPMPGFAAGPCLLKDTMQLAAFDNNNFVLGHSAMLINEGLPLYLVSKLEQRFDLGNLTVGVLGMAFKGGSDDSRESLAYKLRKILSVKARSVLCTDPYIADERFAPIDKVLADADILVIATPHREYAGLETELPVVDIWGLTGRGVLV